MKKIITIALLVFICSLTIATQVLALTTPEQRSAVRTAAPDFIPLQVGIPFPNCKTDENFVCDNNQVIAVKDATALVTAIFQFGIILGAIVMVTIMVIGGGQYMLSAGVSEKAYAGKEKIIKGFYGLTILIFSVVILNQINPALVKLSLTAADKIEARQLIIKCPDAIEHDCSATPYKDQCFGTKCADSAQYCSVSKDPTTGERKVNGCIARALVGADCEENEACKSGSCDPTTKKCVESKAGKPCTTSTECNGLVCEHNNTATCSFGELANDCSTDSDCLVSKGYKCVTSGRNFCNYTKSLFARCQDDADCQTGYVCAQSSYYDNLVLSTDNDQSTCVPQVRDSGGNNIPLPVYGGTTTLNCQNAMNALKGKDCGTDVTCQDVQAFYNDHPAIYFQTNGNNFCSSGEIGTPCDNGSECKSGICNTFGQNVCSPGTLGQTCDSDDECDTRHNYKCDTSVNFCVLK